MTASRPGPLILLLPPTVTRAIEPHTAVVTSILTLIFLDLQVLQPVRVFGCARRDGFGCMFVLGAVR